MKQTDRFLAICSLAKLAQVVPQKKSVLSPQEQQRRREASMKLRTRNRERLLQGKGRNYEPSTLENIGAGAAGLGGYLATDFVPNLGSGIASMTLGAAKGVANLPADLVGLGNGVKSLFTSQKFEDAYRAGKNGFNNLTGITHINNAIDKGQKSVLNSYMSRNGIDPTNQDDTFGRWGMNGLNLAHGAGYATGAVVGTGLYSKALKGIPAAVRAVKNPGAIVAKAKGIPGAATNGVKNVATRVGDVFRRGAVANTRGIWWKAPAAYTLAAESAKDNQGKNMVDNAVDNANFWNGVRNSKAPVAGKNRSSSGSSFTSDANRLAYYINR